MESAAAGDGSCPVLPWRSLFHPEAIADGRLCISQGTCQGARSGFYSFPFPSCLSAILNREQAWPNSRWAAHRRVQVPQNQQALCVLSRSSCSAGIAATRCCRTPTQPSFCWGVVDKFVSFSHRLLIFQRIAGCSRSAALALQTSCVFCQLRWACSGLTGSCQAAVRLSFQQTQLSWRERLCLLPLSTPAGFGLELRLTSSDLQIIPPLCG